MGGFQVSKTVVSFRIDDDFQDRITRIVSRYSVSRSTFFRLAIEQLLCQEEGRIRLQELERTIDWA
jgi:predicted transcriptional regulator